MSAEPNPEAAPKKKKRPTSQAQIDANRANAQKSTGPKSPEGKRASRGNSLTHGFTALVVDVPGEDPDLCLDRFDAWRPALNPLGDPHVDYMLTLAARKSVRLDRFHVVHTSRAAKLARDAKKTRAEARAREVEELIRGLKADPDLVVRRLKATPEGCRQLLQEWDHLLLPLIDPPHWDDDDAYRALCLLGHIGPARHEAPSIMVMPTRHIEKHRAVATKLKENEFPDALEWNRRYGSIDQHLRDKAIVGDLREKSRESVEWVRDLIETQQSELRERIKRLELEEALDVSEAPLRARFDESDAGKLLHRYEVETERGLVKLFESMQKQAKEAAKATQHHSLKQVRPGVRLTSAVVVGADSAPGASRSEANPTGGQGPEESAPTGEIGSKSPSGGASARPTDPPDRR